MVSSVIANNFSFTQGTHKCLSINSRFSSHTCFHMLHLYCFVYWSLHKNLAYLDMSNMLIFTIYCFGYDLVSSKWIHRFPVQYSSRRTILQSCNILVIAYLTYTYCLFVTQHSPAHRLKFYAPLVTSVKSHFSPGESAITGKSEIYVSLAFYELFVL